MRPDDVVRHLLGVQAQVPSAAQLAIRARAAGLSAAMVAEAQDVDRSIVLTWAMRGTLHLVAAEDVGWLQPLTMGPGVARSHRRLRELGIRVDPARAVRAIERMLGREGPLTRHEVLRGLRRLGIRSDDGSVAYHLLWLAGAEGTVCLGPTRDGERSFVLVRDWIGTREPRDRGAALAEVAARYLAAHAPAAPEDLASWSGIRISDARRAWRALGDRLVEHRTPRATLWSLRDPLEEAEAGTVRLLPAFDEYLLGWKDRRSAVAPERWGAINRGGGWVHPVLLVDGRAAGTWRGERTPRSFGMEVHPFARPSPSVRRGVEREAEDVGRFLGAPVELSLRRPG